MGALLAFGEASSFIGVANIGRGYHGGRWHQSHPGVLKFCPRFDGEDTAYILNNKRNLRVVLSIHRQSVTVIP